MYPLTHQLGDVQVQFVEPENKSHVLSKTLSTSYLKKKKARFLDAPFLILRKVAFLIRLLENRASDSVLAHITY